MHIRKPMYYYTGLCSGSGMYRDGRVVTRCMGASHSVFPTEDQLYSSNLQNRVNVELLAKVKNETGFNAGIEWTQRKRTSDQFTHLMAKARGDILGFRARHSKEWKAFQRAGGVTPDYLSLNKGFIRKNKVLPDPNPRALRAALGRVADEYLAIQYGWKPLIDSVFGGLLLVDEANRNDKFLLRDLRQLRIPSKTTREVDLQLLDGLKLRFEGDRVYGCRTEVWYRITSHVLSNLARAGVTNPAVWAWDFTRFSFLIDWAIPVSNWLSAFDAGLGKEFHMGYTTQTDRYTSNDGSVVPVTAGSNQTFLVTGKPEGVVRWSAMDRHVLSTFPSPKLFYKNPISQGHIMNATALLAAAFVRA